MKRLHSLMLLTLCLALAALPAAAEEAVPAGALATYGGSNTEECTGTLDLADGFLIYGNARSTDGDLQGEVIGEENRAAWAVRVGFDGDVRWTLLIDEPGASFRAASALSDGTYLLALSSHINGVGSYKNYHVGADGKVLSEMDSDHETISQQAGNEGLVQIVARDDGYSLIVTNVQSDEIMQAELALGADGYPLLGWVYPATGGYLLAGSAQAVPDGEDLIPTLGRLDADGNLLWMTEIPVQGTAHISSAVELADGGAVAVGRGVYYPDPDSYDYDYVTFAARVDADGNLLWHNVYQIGEKLQLERVTAVPGGYLAVADTAIHDDINARIYLVRLDEAGEVVDAWPVALSGKWHTIYPNGIAYADGAVYITGSITPSLDSGDFDMDFVLLKTGAEREP